MRLPVEQKDAPYIAAENMLRLAKPLGRVSVGPVSRAGKQLCRCHTVLPPQDDVDVTAEAKRMVGVTKEFICIRKLNELFARLLYIPD